MGHFDADTPRYFSPQFQNKITKLSTATDLDPEWLDALTRLPCLEELKLTGFRQRKRHYAFLSLGKLETIHSALPCLRILSIEGLTVSGEMPKNITPCDTVWSLSLDKIRGCSWGQYFAQKYTGINRLNLVLRVTPNEHESTEARILAKSCRSLQHFECNGNYIDGVSPYLSLAEIFQEINAPLTYLNAKTLDLSLFGKYIRSFHQTLEEISTCTFAISAPKELLGALKVCSRLVDLTLRCDQTTLDLDCILDSCKHLRNLNFTSENIHASNNSNYTTNNQHGHGLLTLSLTGDVHDDVFPFVSQRCPNLSSLVCTILYDTCRSRVRSLTCLNLDILKLDFLKACCSKVIYKVTEMDRTDTTPRCDPKYHTAFDKNQSKNRT
ncbi:hypothetical protein DFQ30_004069, partial [Apophysomyces sp. BC1015]